MKNLQKAIILFIETIPLEDWNGEWQEYWQELIEKESQLYSLLGVMNEEELDTYRKCVEFISKMLPNENVQIIYQS